MANTLITPLDYESYETSFTVDETLDDLLMKFLVVDFKTYGFIKIISTPDNIIDINNITNCGNYQIEHWENGPEMLKHLSPVNLLVTRKVINGQDKIVQMIPFMMDLFYRTTNINDNEITDIFTPWTSTAINNIPCYVGMTEPNVSDTSLWINTTISGYPTIYLYNEMSGWVGIGSLIDAIHATTYDTITREKDIFLYFDEKWGITSTAQDKVTFFNVRDKFLHHKEVYGHMTEEELQKFNQLISIEEVKQLIEDMRKKIIDYILNRIDMMHHDILHDTLGNDWKVFHDHFKSPNHSSSTLKNYWNDKAEADHTHYFDDRIQIRAEDILDGVFSLDLIPDSAIHILKNVLTHKDRFLLTKDDVQNGDSVSVLEETDKYNSGLYLVIDDTKLDSDEGYYYYRTRRFSNIDFVDIIEKPDTLGGYGIDDGSRIVESANDEGIFKFTYPYYTEDDTINYLITSAILEYGNHIGDILDAIESAMKPDDVEGIWNLANENLSRYEAFNKKFAPYHGAHDLFDEIVRIFNETEQIYDTAVSILY